jgi:hypothetical protein
MVAEEQLNAVTVAEEVVLPEPLFFPHAIIIAATRKLQVINSRNFFFINYQFLHLYLDTAKIDLRLRVSRLIVVNRCEFGVKVRSGVEELF